jgi:hypothetical protein
VSLRLLTAAGTLELGDAPESALRCIRCSRPAQLVAESERGFTPVCAPCAEHLIAAAAVEPLCGATITMRRDAWRSCVRPRGHGGPCE